MTEDREFFIEASRYTLRQSYADAISTMYSNSNVNIKYRDKNGRYLIYMRQRYDLPDDPRLACKLIVSLLKHLEIEKSQIPDDWNKIPKFMKGKMIEEYVASASDILSKEHQLKLMVSIKVGIFTNSIKTKNIIIKNGKINSIEGINYDNLDISLKTPLLRYGDIDGTVIYNPKMRKVKYMDNWVISS